MSSMSERLAKAAAYGQQFIPQTQHTSDEAGKLVFVVGPEDRGRDTDELDWYQTDGISFDGKDLAEVKELAERLAAKAIRPVEAFIVPAGGSIYDFVPQLKAVYQAQKARRDQQQQASSQPMKRWRAF